MVLPPLEFRKAHPIKPSQPIGQKIPLLKDYLAELDDPRQAKGLRHPLTAILSLCCVAMISGAKTPQAMADWWFNRQDLGPFLALLGFTHDYAVAVGRPRADKASKSVVLPWIGKPRP